MRGWSVRCGPRDASSPGRSQRARRTWRHVRLIRPFTPRRHWWRLPPQPPTPACNRPQPPAPAPTRPHPPAPACTRLGLFNTSPLSEPETLNTKPLTLNPKHLTLNPKPFNPKTPTPRPGEVEYAEFEEIMTGTLARLAEEAEGGGQGSNVPFALMATAYRRKKLMEGIMQASGGWGWGCG